MEHHAITPASVPSPPSLWRRIRDANVAASWAMTPGSLWNSRGFAHYERAANALLAKAADVVDAGGGRTWHLQSRRAGQTIVGVDIDARELALNAVYTDRIEVDVCGAGGLGVPDGSADLVLARAVIEHLPDTPAFLRNVYRALRPGGHAVAAFANKRALPMLLNRAIPHALAERLLMALVPGTDQGLGGFRAHYGQCTPRAFRSAAERAGFAVVREEAGYYSSSYTQFCTPIHALNLVYDLTLQALDIRPLCATPVFVLCKPVHQEDRTRSCGPV